MITLDHANTLPDQPGVYLFKYKDTFLYIGKSVNLRTRVKSHIAQAKLSKKEYAIIHESDQIEFMTTLNNFDALLLEAQLIQKHKPQYNVVWKDDKNFLYLKITMGDIYPKIFPVRQEVPEEGSLYFGPFKSTRMTEKLLYELRRIVPFCTQLRISKRPCFYSRIGCCNPCPNYIESVIDPDEKANLRKEYRKNIRKVISILSGRTSQFTKQLNTQLEEYSAKQEYEEAIKIRSKLFQFSLFLDWRTFNEHSSSVNVDTQTLDDDFKSFMETYFPQSTLRSSYRIECYDMSNLFGKHPVGSMVVFQDGLFMKKEYRKFRIKHSRHSDTHMMEEVIMRRLEHDEWQYPDLIILDGGRPQLRHIYDAFRAHQIPTALISIAKRPDRILTPFNDYKPIYIDKDSLLFKLFQSLRDESHRFAKKYHVALRNRNLLN